MRKHVPIITFAALGAALFAAPRSAHAQDAAHRFALRLEGAGGYMLNPYQQSTLNQRGTIEGAVHLAFTIAGPFAIQVSGGQWIFPGPNGFGGIATVTGGLRLEPSIGSVGRLWIDANAGVAFTGPLTRFGLDAGLGFEFNVTSWFAVGPFARYGFVLHTVDDFPADSHVVVGGVTVALRIPAARAQEHHDEHAPPPPPDTDRDGVIDPDDLCVNEPAGAHPDPARRGCPLADTDSDGVFDNADQCVTTPQGPHPDPSRAGCPDGDDDNDTVLNHVDQCPTTHQGVHPDPARPGCPQPDRDNDAIPDASDHCPDQPGAPSPDPKRNGCPGLVRIEGGQIRILNPVFFATNRDRILPRSFPVLDAVADALRVTPEIHRIAVEGHTDSVGNDARNLDLSERRAVSVVRYLTAHGIEAARLESHGYGETRPMQPNTTPAGRAANRRVQFQIVDPAQAPPAP